MIGHTVPASGIAYSERHSIGPDGSISERFGKPLEIPEDLMPIPDERPGVLQSTHPLAKYVHLRCYADNGSVDFVVPSGVFFVDGINGVIARVSAWTAKAADAHGTLPTESVRYKAIEITYDEDAIEEENRRRLTKALEIAGYYEEVIDIHKKRFAERAEKQAIEDAERAQTESIQASATAEPIEEPEDEPDARTEDEIESEANRE